MRITRPYKTCRLCGCTKPKEEFLEGRRICLSCSSAYRKQLYRERHPDRSDGVRYSKEAQQLVEYRNGYQRKYWNPQMIADFRKLYPVTRNEELASLFGVSCRTINRKAEELGLRKDIDWMRQISRQNSFFATVKNRANGYSQLVKARKALEIKYNNSNFTRIDRERYDRAE